MSFWPSLVVVACSLLVLLLSIEMNRSTKRTREQLRLTGESLDEIARLQHERTRDLMLYLALRDARMAEERQDGTQADLNAMLKLRPEDFQ